MRMVGKADTLKGMDGVKRPTSESSAKKSDAAEESTFNFSDAVQCSAMM